MSSRKGLMRKLREHEIILMVPKRSKPLTRDEIDFFAQERKIRKAYKA